MTAIDPECKTRTRRLLNRPLAMLSLILWLALTSRTSAMWPSGEEYLPPPRATPTAQVRPGDSPGAVYYTVRPGDTLWQIARRFGVTVSVVQKANGFDGKKVLREGMTLHLPYSNEVGTAKYGSNAPVVKGQGLHFVSSIKQQHCWLFRDGTVIEQWTCSTGRPGSPSIPGNYTIQTKMPRAYNAAADFWMPSWLGIYDAGQWENGIHGIPYRSTNGERLWTDLVGTPITYGCVMLDDQIAYKVYQMAYVGMPVTVLP